MDISIDILQLACGISTNIEELVLDRINNGSKTALDLREKFKFDCNIELEDKTSEELQNYDVSKFHFLRIHESPKFIPKCYSYYVQG